MTGTHGLTTSLNRVHSGIQINMRKMNSLQVNADGKTATVGGGIMQYEITKSLYKSGKQAGEHGTPTPYTGMAVPTACPH